MLPRGIPETPDEARSIIHALANLRDGDPALSHYPGSQLVALAVLTADLDKRLAKPRRGRPPKNANPERIDHADEQARPEAEGHRAEADRVQPH